jgi:hypothetical protein
MPKRLLAVLCLLAAVSAPALAYAPVDDGGEDSFIVGKAPAPPSSPRPGTLDPRAGGARGSTMLSALYRLMSSLLRNVTTS